MTLIIIFNACPLIGLPAKYYVITLQLLMADWVKDAALYFGGRRAE